MSDETKKPAGPGYTVDEILAEYGSKGGQGPRPEQIGRASCRERVLDRV